jgi:hypothetical protein
MVMEIIVIMDHMVMEIMIMEIIMVMDRMVMEIIIMDRMEMEIIMIMEKEIMIMDRMVMEIMIMVMEIMIMDRMVMEIMIMIMEIIVVMDHMEMAMNTDKISPMETVMIITIMDKANKPYGNGDDNNHDDNGQSQNKPYGNGNDNNHDDNGQSQNKPHGSQVYMDSIIDQPTEPKNAVESVDSIEQNEVKIRNYLDTLFNNSLSINDIRVTTQNNAVTVYVDLSFGSGISSQVATDFCNELKEQIQPITNRKFNNCIYPDNTRYVAGNLVTMMVISPNVVPSGAMGLASSAIIMGISTLLHILY